jgi:hypothetical protein
MALPPNMGDVVSIDEEGQGPGSYRVVMWELDGTDVTIASGLSDYAADKMAASIRAVLRTWRDQ